MADHAISTDPAVQRQLDRLMALSPGADILGLERIHRLLARLGDPQYHLPPVFHVAGTNGKGSTCAFLRAAMEADGLRVHAYTSPHLVRFNERIRVAGRLISDDALAPLLEEVLDRGGDIGASFFEVTTAAAFLAFSRTPADACILEVGLGGRLDATNVLRDTAVCGIAQLGIDHEAFLGPNIEGIAREKAGIAKPGRPMVTQSYPFDVEDAVREVADGIGAPLFVLGKDWAIERRGDGLLYSDARGLLELPLPRLAGAHQHRNLGLAVAMIRHQDRLTLSENALRLAPVRAHWPARMQHLSSGPLTAFLPDGSALWLDGGHNPDAGIVVAAALREILAGKQASTGADMGRRPCCLVLGMLANKDPHGLLDPIAPMVDMLVGVPVPGHAHHAPEDLAVLAREFGIPATATAQDAESALRTIADACRTGMCIGGETQPPVVLILGSLYLAGTVLEANHSFPD